MTLTMSGGLVRAVIAAIGVAAAAPADAAERRVPSTAAVTVVRSADDTIVSRPVQLSAAIEKAARAHSGLLEQTPQPKRWSCSKSIAVGTAIGAGIGAALSVAVLHAIAGGGDIGGRDYADWTLRGFAPIGAVGGFMIGSRGCGV